MSSMLCLVLLAAPQDPWTGEVGKIHWPPRHGTPLYYQAHFTKRRVITPETERAAREAFKELGGKPPKRQPRQAISMDMAIQLVGGESSIRGMYRTTVGKHSLRMKLLKPKRMPAGESPLAVAPALLERRLRFQGFGYGARAQASVVPR